jgi:periplasmic protein TonB
MMERNSHEDYSQKLALAMTICLHLSLLIGAYYLPFKRLTGSSSGYSIALNPSWSSQEKITKDAASNPLPPCQLSNESEDKPKTQRPVKDKKATEPIHTEAIREKVFADIIPEPQNTPDEATTTEQVKNTPQDLSEAITAIDQNEATTGTIDERSLYRAHQGKQTGALLELAGWMWDATPQPQDNTDESGKIVFQITVDDLGEVIAVKTLEKTVSPLVENIYKEALTTLSFSKTTDHAAYAPTCTGKITFMLQVK